MLNLDAVAIFSILTIVGSVVMLVVLGMKARAKIFTTNNAPSEDDHG
jgi:hypothetical protein